MNHFNHSQRWSFDAVVPADESDVSLRQKLAACLDAKSAAEISQIVVGQPLVEIRMKDDSYRRFDETELKEFFETAKANPVEKAHQLPALREGIEALKAFGTTPGANPA